VAIPPPTKCRIGIDDQDPEAALDALADAVIKAGVDALIVHARKAWLQGLSPRENREVPPLDHARVYRLKERHPGLPVILNGGIETLAQARAHLAHLDGVMMGRAAYKEPWRLLDVDALWGEAPPAASAREAAVAMLPYIEHALAEGVRLNAIVRHMLGLFAGIPGARAFRRHLATAAVQPGAGCEILEEALAFVAGAPFAASAAA
jgi:tRNA-dihydrouridine synthase A